MAAEPICAECGAPLLKNAPGNRCPKCLLQLALEEAGLDEAAHAKVTPRPTREESAGAHAAFASLEERIGAIIGRYRLLQKIVVFMAEQIEPVRRKVAIKPARSQLPKGRIANPPDTQPQENGALSPALNTYRVLPVTPR